MRTFSIYTLGCKVNQYESSQIRQFLEDLGLSAVRPDEKPDLFVINTCCVTATASAKSRQYIQRAKKLNQRAVKVVCGCLPAIKSNELRITENKSTCLVTSKEILASKLYQIVGGARSGCSLVSSMNISNIAQSPPIKPENKPKINPGSPGFAGLTSLPNLPPLTSFKEHTRAFLKVQDGCDGVCSYCIIPKIRTEVRSKPIEEAVAEARALVAAGHKEIVVTGVCLGAYGRQTVRRTGEQESRREERKEKKETLSVLLERLAGVEGLRRLRVSSLEPGDISNKLLDVFCKYPNIMPHIHLSVQSGADRILKRMCRPYSADELREKIGLIKSRLDRPAITCDIIVGFPGETEEDFEQTYGLAKWAGFSKIHCFPFSARMGTAAAKFKDKLQPKLVKKRAEVLRKLGDELGRKFREQFIGEMCEVLVEETEPVSGRCERYYEVQIQDDARYSILDTRDKQPGLAQAKPAKNEILTVKITGVRGEGAEGKEGINGFR